MASLTLYKDNDNLLTLTGLQNESDDSYVNDATVTVTLYEDDGTTEVSGQTWPQTMSYKSGSDGVYEATLEEELSVTPGWYKAQVDVDAGSDLIARWVLDVRATVRTT